MLAATPVPPPELPPEPPPLPPPDPPPELPEPPAMDEPFSATVVAVSVEVASTAKPSMTPEARVISTPSGISAMVSLMPMLSAKDTPTPVDEAVTPVPLGSAVTVLSVTLSASMVTGPPVRLTLVAAAVAGP
jgi:hypothetical protein